MVLEHIESLKLQYTDKYVVVDGNRPELRRFARLTGQVRTVNMNGRALVEFKGNNNIGWYDIDLAYLKVVDPPSQEETSGPAKTAEKTVAKTPAAKTPVAKTPPATTPEAKTSTAKTPATVQSPPAKGGAGKVAPAGGLSVADILAQARGGGAPSPASPKAAPSPAPEASPAATAPPADAKKLSVAEILAAARSKPAPETTAEEPEPVSDARPAPAKPAAGPKSASGLPKSTADIIAWCRTHDSK